MLISNKQQDNVITDFYASFFPNVNNSKTIEFKYEYVQQIVYVFLSNEKTNK